jgi:hypothetical protein
VRKPIGPALHGALDYGFFTAMLMVPRLLGLPRRARILAAALGSAQGGLNAVTDQPLAARRLVAYRTHGSVDRAGLPVALGLPLLTGAMRDGRARTFFLAAAAALAAVYALTDWNAQERASAERGPQEESGATEGGPQEPESGMPGPQSLGSAGPDAEGTTDARSTTDPATPAEGPADAAGPSDGAIGVPRSDGPRRPSTVDTAPDVRGAGAATTSHSARTGAEAAGRADEPQPPRP